VAPHAVLDHSSIRTPVMALTQFIWTCQQKIVINGADSRILILGVPPIWMQQGMSLNRLESRRAYVPRREAYSRVGRIKSQGENRDHLEINKRNINR
jgi:hypothetical protein